MASNPTSSWTPDWAVPPGETLLEALQDRGMTQSELAARMARPLKTVNEIIKGKAAITSETAIQLERALGISARFWTNLEANYRESLARHEAQTELEKYKSWLIGFPITDLVHHKLISRGSSKSETLANVLSYLGLSSPAAFDRHWLDSAASFRSSPAFMASPKAVASWLRWGEIKASEIKCPPFDARRFRQVLNEVRPLTRRGPFMQIFNRVKEMCLESGVIVILVPELKGTHLSGATRWLGNKAVIQLSLRHKSDDQFWFSFYHEGGHVLSPSRHRDFVDAAQTTDEDTTAEEDAANRFARDVLLPPDDYRDFLASKDFTKGAVRSFAEQQEVAPGIVVGRLQREKKVSRTHLNDLKKPIHWPTDLNN